MRRSAIVILSIITVLVLFVVLCTYRVRPYETVVLNRFGRVVPPEEQTRIAYGWHFCWPTDKVVRLDRRLHLHETALVQWTTSDSKPISIRAFAAWQIADPKVFYERFVGSDDQAQNILDGKIRGNVASVLGNYSLDKLFQAEQIAAATQPGDTDLKVSQTATHEIEAKVTAAVNAEMKSVGMKVVEIGFSRMAFPPLVAESVYDRMRAEREKIAKEIASRGDAEATGIRSEGERNASNIIAEARRRSEEMRGEGDAEALAILSQVQTEPEQKKLYELWRELELMKSVFGKGTYLVLRSDEPLSSQLFGNKPSVTTQPAEQPMVGGQPAAPLAGH